MTPKISEVWRFQNALSIFPYLHRNTAEAFLSVPDDSFFRFKLFDKTKLCSVEANLPEADVYLLRELFSSTVSSSAPRCEDRDVFMSPFPFHMMEGQSFSNMIQNEVSVDELNNMRAMLEKNLDLHPENKLFLDGVSHLEKFFLSEDINSITRIGSMAKAPKRLHSGRWLRNAEHNCKLSISYNAASTRPFFLRITECVFDWTEALPLYPYFGKKYDTMCIALKAEEFLAKVLIPACDYGEAYRQKVSASMLE